MRSTFAKMNPRSRWLKALGILAAAYAILPLVVFDFGSPAVPYDEDNYDGRSVAIGPRPWWWVPFAAHGFDIPGGADYSPNGWAFRLWKPICLLYCQYHGYALPCEWR